MKLRLAQDFKPDERQNYIGGSEIAILFGYGAKTIYQLWEEKTGRKQPEDLSNNPKVQAGKLAEDFIASLFEFHNPDKKLRISQRDYKHPQYPFCCAHIDRLVACDDTIIECKNTGEYCRSKWEDNQLPEEHILQVNYQMGLSHRNNAIVVGWLGGWDYQERPVAFSNTLFDEQIERVKKFWWHVDNDVPPEKVWQDCQYTRSNGNIIELYENGTDERRALINDFNDAVAYYLELSAEETSAKKCKTDKAGWFKNLILENDGIATEKYVVTYISSVSDRFDTKKFAEEHEKLYKKYLSSVVSRKINVKKNPKYEVA